MLAWDVLDELITIYMAIPKQRIVEYLILNIFEKQGAK